MKMALGIIGAVLVWCVLSVALKVVGIVVNVLLGAVALALLASAPLRAKVWGVLKREAPKRPPLRVGLPLVGLALVGSCLGVAGMKGGEKVEAEAKAAEAQAQEEAEKAKKEKERIVKEKTIHLEKAESSFKSKDYLTAIQYYEKAAGLGELTVNHKEHYALAAYEFVASDEDSKLKDERKKRLLQVAIQSAPDETKKKARELLADAYANNVKNSLAKAEKAAKKKDYEEAEKHCTASRNELKGVPAQIKSLNAITEVTPKVDKKCDAVSEKAYAALMAKIKRENRPRLAKRKFTRTSPERLARKLLSTNNSQMLFDERYKNKYVRWNAKWERTGLTVKLVASTGELSSISCKEYDEVHDPVKFSDVKQWQRIRVEGKLEEFGRQLGKNKVEFRLRECIARKR